VSISMVATVLYMVAASLEGTLYVARDVARDIVVFCFHYWPRHHQAVDMHCQMRHEAAVPYTDECGT